jgi:flagellar hook-basal body complex protein FliE
MMETDTAAHLSRRQVIRAFKMRGLSLQSAALEAMMNVLQRESSRNSNSSSSSSSDVLNAILDEIRERILSARSQQQQSIVTKGLLAEVVADMSRDGRDVHEEALQLLDAYDTPRLEFDTMRKQFSLLTSHSPDNEPRSFFGDANSKVSC